jgi:hypothetical protein
MKFTSNEIAVPTEIKKTVVVTAEFFCALTEYEA